MTIPIIIALASIALARIFFYGRNKMATATNKRTPFLSMPEATAVVGRLMELGYFKYAAPEDLDELKNELCTSISDFGILSTSYLGTTTIPKDHRLYLLDGEELFEEGGFTNALNQMQELFNKMNLKFEISDHIEEWDDTAKALNHELTVNGKRYEIFKSMKEYGWGEAALYFAQMINDQLHLQQKDEKMYLINGGNDGSAVFLTHDQLDVVQTLCKERKWRPLPTEEWCLEMQVTQ